MRSLLVAAAAALGACADAYPPPPAPPPIQTQPAARAPLSFDDALALLRAHAGPVDVLAPPGGRGRIAVSARWQGRVMTSAVEPRGGSLGFLHRAFIEAGKTGTPFDNYGGEDRFWLGPEGGQFGLYFPPGAPFAMASWQTPHAMQEGEWDVTSRDAMHVTFVRAMRVVNWSGAAFDVAVERTVRALAAADVRARFGEGPPPGAEWVAFESVNRITNAGTRPWTRDAGLVSVWILGMYNPAPDARVIVPFVPQAAGPIVNDAYFGKVPPERLAVHDREGWLTLVADGEHRSKIGVGPARASDTLGSWTPSAHLLTLVRYDKPRDAPDGYVNSMWARQQDPYGGDVVNAYNDGPTEPGKPSLGGFYELETSSPAAALAPGQSLVHVHTTLHVTGDPASLEPLAKRALGVSLAAVAAPQAAAVGSR
jgi:hypothetical protein